MSKAKHTPGPWTFSRYEQFGETRFYVAQQDGAPFTHDYSDVATLIAETVSGERVSIQEANARLIGAAPELLTALRGLLDALPSSLSHSAIDAARAAITKSEQESPNV